MSVRHIKDYYDEVANQYIELREELKEFSSLAEQNMFEPERIEKIKESIQPLMRNYEVLSYIMYLLNMPNRSSKEKGYEQRNKKLLAQIKPENTKDGVISQNSKVINDFKENNGLNSYKCR